MKRTFLISILFFFIALQVFADWKIVITTTTSEGTEYESTFYIKDGILKQETPEMTVIINLKTNNIIYANNTSQSYWKGSKEDFEKELEELMEKMMIEMLGEEGYKQMKEMEEMGDSPEGAVEVEIIQESESMQLAGFGGTKHSVMVDGQLAEELWLCKEIDAFNEFSFEEMGEMFGQEGENDYVNSSQYKEMIRDKGFPIKEITYSYGEIMETVHLVSADNSPLSPKIFEAPEGYSQVGLLEVMGM